MSSVLNFHVFAKGLNMPVIFHLFIFLNKFAKFALSLWGKDCRLCNTLPLKIGRTHNVSNVTMFIYGASKLYFGSIFTLLLLWRISGSLAYL